MLTGRPNRTWQRPRGASLGRDPHLGETFILLVLADLDRHPLSPLPGIVLVDPFFEVLFERRST